MGLDIKHTNRYKISIKLGLEEGRVNNFIDEFRRRTEPLRLKAYEDAFDEQVEDHLSNDEYNKDNNGYK